MEDDLMEFRPIPGYEGLYSVNQNNQVLSHARKVMCRKNVEISIKEKILITQTTTDGYLKVTLCKHKVEKWQARLHILVAMAWNLKKESNHNVIKHLNNNKQHNYISNLQWDTQSQNTIDAINDGLREYKGKLIKN